jgi:DHA2 family multidrug resistance protein
MTLGVGALQLFLDRGNSEGWFDATSIKVLLIIALCGLAGFIYRSCYLDESLIKLRLLANRNFGISSLLMLLFCLGMFGSITTQALLLEGLMGYPVVTTGLVMAPRGLTSALAMAIVSKLMRVVDARWLILLGIFFSALGSWQMSIVNLNASWQNMIWPTVLQGAAMGFFFVPLSALAMSTLSATEVSEAAGLFSFSRSLGTSIGISLMSSIVTEISQIQWHVLGGHVHSANPALQQWASQSGLSLANPATIQVLALQVQQQAQMVAFVDAYWAAAILLFASIPLVFLLQQVDFKTSAVVAGH